MAANVVPVGTSGSQKAPGFWDIRRNCGCYIDQSLTVGTPGRCWVSSAKGLKGTVVISDGLLSFG